MTPEQVLLMNASTIINKLILTGDPPPFIVEEAREWFGHYDKHLTERLAAQRIK